MPVTLLSSSLYTQTTTNTSIKMKSECFPKLFNGIESLKSSLDNCVEDIIDKYREEGTEDAFFVCDIGDVLKKYETWQRLLPRVAPHYAVKCNADKVVLKIMAGIGMGFDCASKAEIQMMLDCGVTAERIVYANPCKQTSHIKFAAQNNVSLMTFDNEDELYKIKYTYPDAKLILRILPVKFKAVVELGNKFGCPPRDVPKLLARAKALDLDIVGVSFHVGSGCQDAAAYPSAVCLARDTFDQAVRYGFKPYLLDIGGGFPGSTDTIISFDEIVAQLSPALDKYFPASSGVEIIAEPGRYFMASAYTLAVNVIAKRATVLDKPDHDEQDLDKLDLNEEPAYMYYVNDGVYGSFNCLLYDHATVTPAMVGYVGEGEMKYSSSIWGPTCDGLDCISNKQQLPELYVGDWIMFRDMGAYSMSASSTFNGMARPTAYYVCLDNCCCYL